MAGKGKMAFIPKAYENRQCTLAEGKVMGGSGSLNGLLYVRGNARDYNRWEELGNPGWSYSNVLKYFKKSENSQIPNGDEGYHGFAGPLNSAYTTPTTQFNRMFSDAFQELGFEELDYNGAQQIGVSQLQQSTRFGRRASGAINFVNAARNRMNFNVTLQAYVTKIMIDESSRTADGVLFVRDGKKYKAIASKEVIISAGALTTPQLLMLSGIGPKQELQKHNIRLIRDLPVGKAFKAHASIRNLAFRTNTTLTVSLTELVEDYLEGRDRLTGIFGSISVSYVNMKEQNNSLPDVEFVMLPPVGVVKELVPPMTYREDISRGLSSLINIGSDFQIQPVILSAASVGEITLKSANPIDFPNIDLGLLTAEEDLEKLFKAGRYMVNLSRTKAFRRVNATFLWEIVPCNKYTPNSRKFWYCTAKYFGFTYSHSSTARMGPPTDPLAVVNHELKVYDVRNLRIADCSITPGLISGHTNAVAFMIGEKAADMIKSRFGKP